MLASVIVPFVYVFHGSCADGDGDDIGRASSGVDRGAVVDGAEAGGMIVVVVFVVVVVVVVIVSNNVPS